MTFFYEICKYPLSILLSYIFIGESPLQILVPDNRLIPGPLSPGPQEMVRWKWWRHQKYVAVSLILSFPDQSVTRSICVLCCSDSPRRRGGGQLGASGTSRATAVSSTLIVESQSEETVTENLSVSQADSLLLFIFLKEFLFTPV